jgi:phosphate:Na+ symporter
LGSRGGATANRGKRLPITPRQLTVSAALLLLAWGLWASAHFTYIAAGVAIFLFGMTSLEQGFRAFAGGALEKLLRVSTDRLWKSIAFGIFSTTLAQSSTLVSLITISFVSTQMMSLAAGIGVILGTNLGSTTGAWLIAGLGLRVNIGAYAMPLLVFGVLGVLQKARLFKAAGYLLLGIGFLFLGIHYMKEGFDAFQDTVDLTAYAVTGFPGLLLYLLIGVVMTLIMQSSHATLLVVIAALAVGQISYENSLALAIGANLGSAITSALAGMAARIDGKRLALSHLGFNVLIVTLGVVFFEPLRWLVDATAGWVGIAETEFLLKLALFHTLFNLLGVLLLLPFVGQLEGLLIRYVRAAEEEAVQPRHLSREVIQVPEAAVAAAAKEVAHLYENAFDLLAQGLSVRRELIRSEQPLTRAVRATKRVRPLDIDDHYERRIKSLHSAIVEFISRASAIAMPTRYADRLYGLRQAAQSLVAAVKDMKHLHKNLSRHGVSSNEAIRDCYDEIRLHLAGLLREIEVQRAEQPDAASALSLDAARLSLERFYRQLNLTLEESIRRRQMTAHAATSLMNDLGYAYDIGKNLIAAAQALFIGEGERMRQVQQHLALDESDIEQALSQRPPPESKGG